MLRYLVTTHYDRIPLDHQIIMVDGTVPGWVAQPGDLHFDHHRPQGSEIQIAEIPLPEQQPLIAQSSLKKPICLVTTMVDADACCAAAWVQLSRDRLTPDSVRRLHAIAWDCDHLYVPESLRELSEFAANAVASLKLQAAEIVNLLNLPCDRETWSAGDWEQYVSEQFQLGTEWLLAAAQGQRPYPGAAGEAAPYWQALEQDIVQLIGEQRIVLVPTHQGAIAVCDLQGLSKSIDPRAFYKALEQQYATTRLRPETLMLRRHRQGGLQYTLGCLPTHPNTRYLDYTRSIFTLLTAAERAKQPQADAWGGRRTVGGSPWNIPSLLTVQEIVAILDS